MTLKYVVKNLLRRKIRTILMLMALIVGVGALVALNATVDTYERFYVATISNSAGDYDLVITKNEIEPDLLIDERTVIPLIEASNGEVKRVVPRFQGVVDVDARPAPSVDGEEPGEIHGSAQFVALNRLVDDMGDFEVISGTIDFAPGYAVVLQETADTFDLKPGDTFDIGYSLPTPRQKGLESAANVSARQARTTLTVSAIALQRGVTGLSGNDGVLVDLDYARNWLGLPEMAERIVVAFDEGIYNNNDPQTAAFRARFLAETIQDILGEAYDYNLPRATILSDSFEQFIFFQALVSIYGILSLSVVGLLVRTMVMTNVREQTRDLALFRILGAPRRHLFTLVATEIAALGILGIGLGAVGGTFLNNLVIVPFIAEQAHVPMADVPLASTKALILSVATAAVVLTISAYTPARRAASTKIMYAINPGVAEGLGLDDLAKLRGAPCQLSYFLGWAGRPLLPGPHLFCFSAGIQFWGIVAASHPYFWLAIAADCGHFAPVFPCHPAVGTAAHRFGQAGGGESRLLCPAQYYPEQKSQHPDQPDDCHQRHIADLLCHHPGYRNGQYPHRHPPRQRHAAGHSQIGGGDGPAKRSRPFWRHHPRRGQESLQPRAATRNPLRGDAWPQRGRHLPV